MICEKTKKILESRYPCHIRIIATLMMFSAWTDAAETGRKAAADW